MTADRNTDGALRLGEMMRSATPEDADAEWLLEGERRLLQEFNERNGSSPTFRGGNKYRERWPQGLIAAALVLGLAVAFLSVRETPTASRGGETLTFTSEGYVAQSRGTLLAEEHPRLVSFSDGSALSLAPGSRAEIEQTRLTGATLVLQRGTLESSIIHSETSNWSVLLGPYEVKVTGTRFTTSWDPLSRKASVLLHEGAVRVSGAGIPKSVELKRGQRFDGYARGEGMWQRSDAKTQRVIESKSKVLAPSAAPLQESSARATARSPDKAAAENMLPSGDAPTKPVETASATVTGSAPSSWSSLIAQGNFQEVLNVARARGFDACLSDCSIADLRALGDAARYKGDSTLARRALLRLRERSAPEKPRAGYLMGSLEEAQGRASPALSWYRRYALEAPTGALRSEAHAGRIRCLRKLGRLKEAKSAATQYLRLYPHGVGENIARQALK